MRAGRLISIVLLMQNYGKMTSRMLAEQLEVSERTIVRDMEALSAAGIPVYAERGQQGGWLLAEGYRTSLTGLRAEELAALLISSHAHILDDLGKQRHYDDALQKLLAGTPAAVSSHAAAVRQKIHIDGAGWNTIYDTDRGSPYLTVIQEAVWEERKLRLEYIRGDEAVKRIVDPYGLVAKRSVWYLAARSEGEMRTYRISRLQGVQALDEGFEREPNFDLASYWEQSLEQFKERLPRYPAQVIVKESLLGRLSKERFVKLGEAEPAADGWLRADLEFETLESACEIVLSFGSGIEALAPEELRLKVLAEIDAARMLYL